MDRRPRSGLLKELPQQNLKEQQSWLQTKPAGALSDTAARQLANTTKTPPQLTAITPRWLVQLLSWVPVESGTYRVNKAKSDQDIDVACGARDERKVPESFVDYEEKPREYTLSAISTIVEVQTRVSDLYSHPHDQIREQLRLTVEKVKERQEHELVNNSDYGLLNNVAPEFQREAAQRRAHARRPRRAHRQGLEGARVLPRASRAPSPRSAASAPAAASRRPRPRSSARRSSPGAAFRSIPSDKLAVDAAGKSQHPSAAHRREAAGRRRPLPARPCPASRPPASPSASWASIATPSPPTSSRSTAPPRC